MRIASKGKSVDETSVNNPFCNNWSVELPAVNSCSLNPMKAAIAIVVRAIEAIQIERRRNSGIPQTKKNMIGTNIESHIVCIETNALVGGSQPHSPQRFSKWGMGTVRS